MFAESAPVAPLVAFAGATWLGVDPTEVSVLVAFLLAEAAGVWLYVAEIRYRFKNLGGRRR